jgi:pimeloyl-ACP methyl ester carboxylesterase
MIKKFLLLTLALFFIASASFSATIQLPQTGQTKCYDANDIEISCAGTGQDGEVQAGVAWPEPRFSDNGDGTVTDTLTGLIWLKDANCITSQYSSFDTDGIEGDGRVTWQHALDFIAGVNNATYPNCRAGYGDWRLPNINELESLIGSGGNLLILNFMNAPNKEAYWSSTTAANSVDVAYVVDFYGQIQAYTKNYTNTPYEYFRYYVWPVRAGQIGNVDLIFPANIGKTGQMISYSPGDDGDLSRGVEWPNSRFKDNGDGTISDNLTGLVWTRDAKTPGPIACNNGSVKNWQGSLDFITCLNNNSYLGYNDWRLPNKNEMYSLADFSQPVAPLLPFGSPFTNVSAYYWTSTSFYSPNLAWVYGGNLWFYYKSGVNSYFDVWPVRGGQVGGTFKLPDTGQTACYDMNGNVISCEGTGQDGAYIINPMSFTDNGDGTVMDNNTGLMWQKEDDDNTYNWYQATGTYDATYNPSSEDVCGSLNLGGHSDWRLPTKRELMSIVNYGIPYPGPTIEPVFSNTKSSLYWSSTTLAYDPSLAWYVVFDSGFVVSYFKANSYYVRCVRGGQDPPPDLVDNGNGTVTDNRTSLIWQRDEPGYMTWGSALSYCEGLSLGGHSDWRLPNIKELESLTDDTRYLPAIDTNFFPNAYASYYWSSTTNAYYPDYAWSVPFHLGYVVDRGKYGYYYVRCVRGGDVGSSGGDSDTDGLPDDWERQYFGDLVQGPNDDYDHDELTNLQEYQLGTDPTKWDTDGDGVNDGTEVANGTNPLIPDVTLEPNISVDPLSSYFGEFDAGEGCLAEQAITISNTGDIDLSISEIALSNTNDFKLSITGLPCDKPIKAGQNCTLTVSFCPTSGGVKATTLGITSNDPDTPKINVQLSGRRLIPADYITKIYEAGESTQFMKCNENITSEKRIPLIVIHGIHGTGDPNKNGRLDEIEKLDAAKYWSSFAEKFCDDGELRNKYRVYLFSYLSDIFSVKEIAKSLRNSLDAYIVQDKMEDTQFVILAHSMGGLVARSYMKQHSHKIGYYKDRKGGERTTLITLATPHHGTPMACSQSRDALALNADARAPDRNYIFWWGPLNDWYTTLKTGSLFYWWVRLGERVAYNHPNRKDLLWDNFDGVMNVHNTDLNKWLVKELNAGTKYDEKLIVYYGYIDNYGEDYLDIVRQIYTKKTSGGPNILLTRAYDNKNDEHKLLTYSSIMMAYGLSKKKDSPYAKNDGMVPKQSAAFDGHTVARQVECPNHDHADMKFDIDGDKKCVNDKSLFEYVRDDLLNIH